MVTRNKCLYNNEIIGIESIYTLVNGKQINKEDEVKRIRALGRANQLFCPCGCGANLILIAGEKNLVRQHFRTRSEGENDTKHNCTWKEESDLSIQSKIILKCWLENKMDMGEEGIKYALRASDIAKSGRKFEYSFYSPKNNFGLVYTKDKRGIYDEKLTYLNEFSNTRTLYITDIKNHNTTGQYPEFMKKMQNQQSFCAFLSFENENEYEYEKAYLRTVFYRMNSRGLWVSHDLSFDKLDAYTFDENSNICINGETLINLAEARIKKLDETEVKLQEKEKEAEENKKLEFEKQIQEHLSFEQTQRNEIPQPVPTLTVTPNIQINSSIPIYIFNPNPSLDTGLKSKEVSSKVMTACKYICEKGRNLEGTFLYKDKSDGTNEGILRRIRLSVYIDRIELRPSLITLYDRMQGRSFYIFINEHIDERELLIDNGIPYCNVSLRYTPEEDIWRVMNKQFTIR